MALEQGWAVVVDWDVQTVPMIEQDDAPGVCRVSGTLDLASTDHATRDAAILQMEAVLTERFGPGTLQGTTSASLRSWVFSFAPRTIRALAEGDRLPPSL